MEVIRKKRRRIVTSLSDERGMEKEEGNGGWRRDINDFAGETKPPPVPDCLGDELP
jgi:hypothetical protein